MSWPGWFIKYQYGVTRFEPARTVPHPSRCMYGTYTYNVVCAGSEWRRSRDCLCLVSDDREGAWPHEWTMYNHWKRQVWRVDSRPRACGTVLNYWRRWPGSGWFHRRMNCSGGQLFGCCYDKRRGAAARGMRDMATRRRRLHGVIVTLLLRAASTRACTWRSFPPRPVAAPT